ncbi:MAG: glycoside hydrolase family 2 protein [Bacteroidota bacterium]|nr:glycoside hydrolase family 2 protein [Bacteroidota bacterium]
MIGLFASIILLFSCSQAEKPLFEAVSLTENWTFQSESIDCPLSAKIPGNYVIDLVRHNQIPHPYMKVNVTDLQIGREDVIYYCEFDKPVMDFPYQDLVFDGIDTYAEIYLNEKHLGSTKNMHRQYRFPVDNLKAENNQLEVRLSAPLNVLDSLVSQSSLILPEEFAYMRKASFQFGWDWAPETPSLGIWRDVRLELYDDFRLINAWVETLELSETKSDMLLVVKMDVKNNCKLKVNLNTDAFDFESQTFDLTTGEQIIHIPFHINNPELWYPNGMGNPFLYHAKLEMKTQTGLFQKEVNFGVRTIELRREKDSIGESFEFVVNGIPVFAKGANYVPQDAFLSQTNHEELLQACVDANFNMLRVWGGGIYEDDRFYDLCDSLGLMVWQDFMFACALYPGDSAFLGNVKIEVEQQIDRLRGHASMALWCGNNEVKNAWFDWGWQSVFNWSVEDSTQIWNQNAYLFNDMIPRILLESGVETDYLPSSPVWGWGHDESLTEGDNHYWGVWWGEEPFESYREHTGRFMSEFGFQAWPMKASLEKFHKGEPIAIESEIMKAHQRHPFGDRLIREYMQRYFGEFEDPQKFAEMSQTLQAYGIGEAIRWFRVQEKCAGSLYWQLNDCWPAISWSSIDYYGEWKALHFAVKDAYAPYMLYAVEVDAQLMAYLVSDAPESRNLTLSLEWFDGDALLVFTEIKSICTEAYNHQEQFALDVPKALSANTDWQLKMILKSENKVLASYTYTDM